MSGRKLQSRSTNCSQQSLMNVLNKFVATVNAMDDRIMIPSRLRDMDVSQTKCLDNTENNNMAVLPISASSGGEDLYSHYVMINAVKQEVLSGTESERLRHSSETDSDVDVGSDSDDGVTDTARQTADAFRHHLQGLFGLLHQMTDTANFLADTYEESVGKKQSKKFVI